ncbi:hypothetical protein [Lysobacter xanthus]
MPVSSPPRHPRRRPDGRDRGLPAVAHLLTGDGRIVGGIARRADDFALVIGGRVMTATDSAGMAIAMLRHARVMLSTDEVPLSMRISAALESPAAAEAQDAGLDLEAYLQVLEAERLERAGEREAASRPQ